MKNASTKAAKADRNAAARARRAKRAEEKRDAATVRATIAAEQVAEATRRRQAELDADAAIVASAKACVQEWLNEPRNTVAMGRAHSEQIRCVLNRRALMNPPGMVTPRALYPETMRLDYQRHKADVD